MAGAIKSRGRGWEAEIDKVVDLYGLTDGKMKMIRGTQNE
jgi:hypothetical protein